MLGRIIPEPGTLLKAIPLIQFDQARTPRVANPNDISQLRT